MESIWDTDAVRDQTKSTLSSYYEALDAGDLDRLGACFVEDAVMLLPGRQGELRPKRGKTEILEFFGRRGAPGDRHIVTTVAETGDSCLVEGVLAGPAEDAAQPFLASVKLADDGRITRYLVFSAPGPADALDAWLAAAEGGDR